MSALVLDAGALIAVERNDRPVLALLRVAQRRGFDLRSNANVLAQVWRDAQGRQANLARLLSAVDVRLIDEQGGRAAGDLLGRAGASDVIDATLVLVARTGDRIVTSDPGDIQVLLAAAGVGAVIVAC